MNSRWLQTSNCLFGSLLALALVSGSNQYLIAQDFGLGGDPAVQQGGGNAFDMFGGQQPAQPEQTEEELAAIQANVDKLNADAKAKAEQGDVNGAIELYDEAIATQRNFVSFYEKGVLLREQEYPNEAIQQFGAASSLANTVADNPELIVQNYVELGLSYLDVEQYNNAIGIFSSALTNLPKQSRNPELLFNLGKAQAEFALNQQFTTAQTRQEDLQKALSSYDQALKINPDYAEALYERGTSLMMLGDLEAALDDLKKCVALDPQNSKAAAQLASASLRRGVGEANVRNGQQAKINDDLQRSVEQYTQFLALVPQSAEDAEEEAGEEPEFRRQDMFLQRSAAYIAMGDEGQGDRSFYYRSAITDAEAAIELDPNWADAHYQVGLAKRMLGDFAGAKAAYTEALEVSPSATEPLLRRGIIFFREGNFEAAKADLSAAIRYSAGVNPRASFWRGLCHSKEDDPRLAVMDYSKAIRYQPIFTMAYYNRGLAYMKLGRFAQAKRDFNKVLSRETDNAQARSLRDQAAQLMRR